MLSKITKDELEFMQLWHYPPALVETLFSNLDNLPDFNYERFSTLRQYQYPMLSFEPMHDFIRPELNEKEQFTLRKTVGDLYNFGGRKSGKSLIGVKADIPLSMLHDENFQCGFSSIDGIHVNEIMDSVKEIIDFHPIFSQWKLSAKGAPSFKISAKNGWKLQSINQNLESKNKGKQYYSKHLHKLWADEMSFETEEVAKTRMDALSEKGAVLRFSGMSNFTRHMPIGKIFYATENKMKVINYPQTISPYWDEKEKDDRIKQYGGTETSFYKIFVLGEVIEDGVSEMDMERVKQCYRMDETIKRFEIKKEQFSNFKNLIIVDRPANADQILISSDIGDGGIKGGTDISVFAEIKNKYKWLYNIVLYNHSEPEQEEVFEYLMSTLRAELVGFDGGEALGRTLYARFRKKYNPDNFILYKGTEKINVDFERDKEGNTFFKKGVPEYRQEFMSEWSVRRLKTLLYEGRMILPFDNKLDSQLNAVISTMSGNRKLFQCISSTGNHLFDDFKVFAIMEWLKKSFDDQPQITTQWGIGVSSWR